MRVEALCAGWQALPGPPGRVLEHTTGYFYQEGFLPSQTEAGEEEDEKEEADDADDANEQPPAKKKKGDN